MVKMKPTFHLAPRFTIKPPPEGPLHLGTIVDNLTDVEPINDACRLPLPGKQYMHTTEGFVGKWSQLVSGEYGVWAKFAIEGLGGKLGLARERSTEDSYRFEKLEEITFTATKGYITQSMNEKLVKQFVEGGKWGPVYMITGLKIARGPAAAKKKGGKTGFQANLGLTQPGGIQGFEVGPNIEHKNESNESMEFEKSDDFIYGIRVKRLTFKRALFSSKRDVVKDTHFHYGATLVDNDAVKSVEGDQDIDVIDEDEIDDQDEEMEDKTRVAGMEETWVVPNRFY